MGDGAVVGGDVVWVIEVRTTAVKAAGVGGVVGDGGDGFEAGGVGSDAAEVTLAGEVTLAVEVTAGGVDNDAGVDDLRLSRSFGVKAVVVE